MAVGSDVVVAVAVGMAFDCSLVDANVDYDEDDVDMAFDTAAAVVDVVVAVDIITAVDDDAVVAAVAGVADDDDDGEAAGEDYDDEAVAYLKALVASLNHSLSSKIKSFKDMIAEG